MIRRRNAIGNIRNRPAFINIASVQSLLVHSLSRSLRHFCRINVFSYARHAFLDPLSRGELSRDLRNQPVTIFLASRSSRPAEGYRRRGPRGTASTAPLCNGGNAVTLHENARREQFGSYSKHNGGESKVSARDNKRRGTRLQYSNATTRRGVESITKAIDNIRAVCKATRGSIERSAKYKAP